MHKNQLDLSPIYTAKQSHDAQLMMIWQDGLTPSVTTMRLLANTTSMAPIP
jgi:hypothetical protein